MEDINTIYYNNFGIAFYWKNCSDKYAKKIQLVFRDTGLLLTKSDLISFSKHIKNALKKAPIHNYKKSIYNTKHILLQTPNIQTTFAVSYKELKSIEDLVKGTLFELEFKHILKHQNIS